MQGISMNRICKTFNLVACLALLTAAPAFTQTPSPEATTDVTAAVLAAHVYVQTHQGVDVFDAAADGKLTLIKSSPFATTGQMAGSNGAHLISIGTNYIHTYAIESNGAVGKQASEIDTQHYSGADCGNPSGLASFLDHSGKFLYVQLSGIFNGGSVACVAWQSYQVKSNGTLDFIGSVDYNGSEGHDATPTLGPTVSSNDKFAYGIFGEFAGYSDTTFSTLARAAEGSLDTNWNFTEKDPKIDPNTPDGPWGYFPQLVQADPSSHLAVLLYPLSFPLTGNQVYGPYQLASYTINDTTGGISTTNTWEDMPTSEVNIGEMNMSTSGKLLAVAGTGLQIFHFNGAAPITKYSSLLLPAVDIDQLAWDKNNHLYALSYSAEELYVYTVTPTSISEVSGSPYKVKNAYGLNGLIVVPKL
jgi:hypothetical protein